MKKRLLRLSKRILILTLCTILLSGSVINRYKITANATSIAASIGAYGASEICVFLGNCLVALLGIGATAEVYQNRDTIAQLGKDFIDSLDLDEVSGWMLTKVDTTGQSYVYGTEALKEIQDMEFTVIQGGNNMPENNNDNDDDGDIDADDRTKELEQMGMWATTYLVEIMEDGVKPLIEGIRNGEENFISEAFDLGLYSFSEYAFDVNGNYILNISMHRNADFAGNYSDRFCNSYILSGYLNPCIYLENYSNYVRARFVGTKVGTNGEWFNIDLPMNYVNHSWDGSISEGVSNISSFDCNIYSANIPIFSSRDSVIAFLKSGDYSDCLNKAKVYQIADWLQEHWTSALTQLNTGIRSLNDNMLIVGEAANQALINQSNGLGYIEDLGNRIATTAPLALPDSIADPIYYPATSPVPELAPEELPWYTPAGNPGTDNPSGDGTGSGDSVTDETIRGSDSFGISTLFGILILLIMILLMLLMIFLSCLAFVIMIFRIPATTGFLPEEMIAGLDYLKTLEIPGFGMSVYAFFMALIYIILIFTVIGMLRKNIDKIKFPRKGKW